MRGSALKERALDLWHQARLCQGRGQTGRAIDLYSESIGLFPTAEAYAFRGWAYGTQHRLDEAIEECKKAIAIDPSLGNSYNDIGSYLLAQGKLDAAIWWLERAKFAPRYQPRHFPHMNLARLYSTKGLHLRAMTELEAALALSPGDPSCVDALARLRRALN